MLLKGVCNELRRERVGRPAGERCGQHGIHAPPHPALGREPPLVGAFSTCTWEGGVVVVWAEA